MTHTLSKAIEVFMKRYLAAVVILFAGTGATWAQTAIPCSEPDPQASGACPQIGLVPNAPDVLSPNPTSIDPNTILVDPAGTSAIPRPRTSQGFPPLIVPTIRLEAGSATRIRSATARLAAPAP
jgi:hypothetical protein